MTRNWTSQANPEMALPNHLTESPQLRSWKLAYPTAWVNLADGHVIDLPCSEKPSAPLPWIYHMWHICASICLLKSELCWWQFSTSIHISYIYIYHSFSGGWCPLVRYPAPLKAQAAQALECTQPAWLRTGEWSRGWCREGPSKSASDPSTCDTPRRSHQHLKGFDG